MDFRCPNCNSTDLRSLSLAFQEGRFSVNTRSRLRGVTSGRTGRMWWSAERPLEACSKAASLRSLVLRENGRIPK